MRIVRVLTRPNLGGPTRQAVALWHAHRDLGVRTLLLVGSCGADEGVVDLAAAGIPELELGAPAPEGGFCVVPGLGRPIAAVADLRAFRALCRALRADHPDLVHTHTTKAGVLGRLAAPKGVAVAHTYHGLVLRDYASARPSGLLRALEARLARRTDVRYAVSESCRQELEELGVSDRVEVVAPAVPTSAFATADRAACRARLAATPQRPVIGMVGRLVRIKRPELFVELARALPQVDAVVLGAGPLSRELRAWAPSNLRFLGAVPRPEEIVPGLDLLILPSRREGFPLAAVEAAAAGVRTVGFDVPGLRDLGAFRGVASLVAEERGLAGLVEAVRALLALGPPPAGGGRDELVRACDPQRVAATLLSSYRAVVERCR